MWSARSIIEPRLNESHLAVGFYTGKQTKHKPNALVAIGLLPLMVVFVFGNRFLFSFGLLFTWLACGDLTLLFMMRKLDKEYCVLDHPDKMGFVLLRENQLFLGKSL